MTAQVQELPRDQRPLSEQFRIIAKKWADADNAAHLMDELKTTVLAQKKTALIAENFKGQQLMKDNPREMTDAKAERLVKSSADWEKYIRDMCKARSTANLLKQQLKYIEMRHREWISADANARKEMGL